MKKILIFAIIACMLLAGCNSGSGTETTAAPVETVPGTTPEASTPATEDGETVDGFSFSYNGTEITFHAPAAPIVEALGEPKKYTESTSCAFQGLDKTYYYGSFYLDTYPIEGEDFVYGWWFADDSVATAEGIYIGAAQAEVEAAYGADAYNGTNAYIVTRGEGTLTVILEDGIVTSIQYVIVLE